MVGIKYLDNNEAYKALFDGNYKKFIKLLNEMPEKLDLSFANLANICFMKVGEDMDKVILTGARLKMSDLRGLDLSKHNLEGASLNGCQISGTYFPSDISAEEIRMSIEYGTRIRHTNRTKATEAKMLLEEHKKAEGGA